MFIKTVCEEIITDKRLTIINSEAIDDSVLIGNLKSNPPILYFDKYSNFRHLIKTINCDWFILRVYDCIKEQVYYFISIKDHLNFSGLDKGRYEYDKDFIDFVYNAASTNPRYVYNTYITQNVYVNNKDEIVFNVSLNTPISREYQMSRDYRTELDFINIVSELSLYKEELYSDDKEVMS